MQEQGGAGAPGAEEGAVEVSVVIAAYQAARTLGAQLEALAGQRPAVATETLVCDNGSTDGTAAVVAAWQDRVPGLRLVDASARRGAGAARNVGARAARGRSLLFCDADDVVGAHWLDAMARALREHAFVAGLFDGDLLNDPALLAARTMPQTRALQPSTVVPGLVHAGAGNMGVRRDVFLAAGGFDVDAPSLEDTDLCLRLQLAGHELVLVPGAVVHVRMRDRVSGTLLQGFRYGTGERWLAERYRDVAAARAAHAAAPAPQAADDGVLAVAAVGGAASGGAVAVGSTATAARASGAPAPAAARAAGAPARSRWAGRVRRTVTRAGAVAVDLGRVRGRADVAALCWSVGWGLGFALGVVPDPPVQVLGRPGTEESSAD